MLSADYNLVKEEEKEDSRKSFTKKYSPHNFTSLTKQKLAI